LIGPPGHKPAVAAICLVSSWRGPYACAIPATLETTMVRLLLGIGFSTLIATSALAHITLETRQAPVGTSYKAILRVPHGCDGSATTAIRVKIPEGLIDAKPMPKPGWTLKIVKGHYAKPYKLFHATVSEGATEIDWSGGKLPDDQYDEFVFRGSLASDLEPGTMLYFPVVQECEKGVQRWIEIPKAGADYPEPAPGLKLLPKP
jgi:uncharacterized protein YcnI